MHTPQTADVPPGFTNSSDNLSGVSCAPMYVVASTVPPPASRIRNASPGYIIHMLVQASTVEEWKSKYIYVDSGALA